MCSHIIFFKFFMKNPQTYHTHNWSKKRQFCQNYTLYYGPKKSRGCPFFPTFHEKITSLMPVFCKKNVNFLKSTLLSCPYFVENTSILLKTPCSHLIFFKFFMKKPQLPCPYLVKKASILSKLHYIMAKKKSIGYPTFWFFTKKSLL